MLLAQGQAYPILIAVDAVGVYWTTQSQGIETISKVPIMGGTVSVVYTTPSANNFISNGLATDGSDLYFGMGVAGPCGNDTMVKCPTSGCGDAAIPMETAGLCLIDGVGLTIDSSSVYWADYSNNVYSCPLAGCAGPPVLLSAAPDAGILAQPRGLAVDTQSLFWAVSTGSMGAITKIPIHGGSTTVVTSMLSDVVPMGVAVNATECFFVADELGGGSVSVMSADKNGDGGVAKTLAFLSGNSPGSLVIDATNVYWTMTDHGTVMTVPLSGGTPSTLASGQNQPAGIAGDSSSLYWVNSGDGTIMKLVK